MESVKTVLLGKRVILLTGTRASSKQDTKFEVESPEKLIETARRNPDAVAFGFVSGSWVASA